MKLSIIIPVFNEEKSIGEVLQKVIKIQIPQVKKEIIVVDDGSTDNSKLKVQSLKLKNDIIYIAHSKNMGKGAAVATGIAHSRGEYIVIQDADLEYDPKFLPMLLSPILQKKTTVVFGTRLKRLPNLFHEESRPLFLMHYLGNRFLSLVVSLLYGQWITDMETCYKIFPKIALQKRKLKTKGFDFEPEITAILLKQKYRITEIPITTTPRDYSEGKKLNAAKEGPKALWILLKQRFTS